MPITIVVQDDAHRLVATATGELSFAELAAFISTERVGTLRDWPLVFDLTDASTTIAAASVRGLADRVGSMAKNEGPRAPVAIVAPQDDLFGLVRMYGILCENAGVNTIRAFRSRASADDWLDALSRSTQDG